MSHKRKERCFKRASLFVPIVLTVSALTASMEGIAAQSAPAVRQTSGDASDRAVMARLVKLRDLFVRRVVEEGYSPSLSPPVIELGDPPTFGDYDPKTNVLKIASWPAMSNEERQVFEHIAKDIGGKLTARQVFENGTYHWVFTHELGHWWQQCQHQTRPNSYTEELGANRIALAFWREQNPRIAESLVNGFRAMRDGAPNPVPQGQSKIKYLNANFERIGASDDYTWYQSDMIVGLAAEAPTPSFHRALSQPLFMW